MATNTTNYDLIKPAQEDFYDIDDLNDNMDKIDTALADKASLIDGKVPTTQLPDMDYIPTTAKGAASGVAPLDESAKVPSANSYAPGEEVSATTPTAQTTGDLWRQGQTVDEGKLAKESLRRRNADGSYSKVFTETHVGAVFMADGATLLEATLAAMNTTLDGLESLLKTIYTVPSQSGSLTYTGSTQTPTWNDFSADWLTIGGTTSATNVGTYTATFTPVDGFTWEDGTTTAKSVSWSIGKAEIAYIPSQSGTLTYTGSTQTPTWNDYNSFALTLAGVTSGTAAGTYTATFTPTSNYMWSDGTTTAKSVAWSIGKATGTLTISPTTLTLGASKTTGSITVTRAGDGTISASSSNTAAATVSVSGTKVTVTAKGVGSATITVTVAAGTNYTAPTSKTCTVTASLPSTTLSANSWDLISEASLAGVASDYWEVGDEKDITVDGETLTLVIMGFNHDSKSSGGTAGITFGMKNLMASERRMNSSSTNSGGFTAMEMYTWLQGTLLSSLPSDLQSVLLSVNKKTSAGSTSATINTNAMKVFLFSEIEVFGSVTHSKSGEGTHYPYLATASARIKKLRNGSGAAGGWWERSPYASTSSPFCSVSSSGSANASSNTSDQGVCFGFCV